MSRRKEYLNKRRNKIQNRKKKSRLQTNVHGVLFAPSPPVADHSLDVVDEQTRNLRMTPRDGLDLRKDLDQAKEYVGSAGQAGPANEGVVAPAYDGRSLAPRYPYLPMPRFYFPLPGSCQSLNRRASRWGLPSFGLARAGKLYMC